jgi:uncharacterized RDD family membrane protein YckC
MNKKRAIAFIFDFLVCCIIQTILMYFLVFRNVGTGFSSTAIFSKILLISYVSILYLMFRDIIGKRSIGKTIMGVEIINANGRIPFVWQRLVRNITWLLGPFEIIYFAIKKERLGDEIAKTKIIIKNE